MTVDKYAKLNTECHELAYEVLKSTASWLEDPDNEIYSLLEEHDSSVEIAARACIEAAAILKKANLDIQIVSGIKEQKQDITVALDKLQSLANEFDDSDDPILMKKAGLLDEILLTVAADIEEKNRFQERINQKIAELKGKNKIAAETNAPTKSDKKVYEENEASLSTRYCPDHPGVQAMPIEDGVIRCSLDGKTYNFKEGFTTEKGNVVPGTSIENQTKLDTHFSNPLSTSDTRESRVG